MAQVQQRKTALLLGGALLATTAAMAQDTATAPAQPNIILIMSDDMGFSDIERYGGIIRTPALNRLADNGLSYRQFYNTARCCPTRASLLTGLHPHQAGIGHMMEDRGQDGYRGELNARCITIAQALKPAGYKTYAVGKWHVTHDLRPDGDRHNWPLQRGFDRYYGIIGGAASYFDPANLCRDNRIITPYTDPEYSYPQADERYYLTEALGDNAAKFIREHAVANGRQPFFMYVAFTAAHWPMQAPERYVRPYHGKFDKGWDVLRQEKVAAQRRKNIIDKRWTLATDSTLPSWNAVENKEFETRCMEVYAGMISCLDHNIGKITEQLRQSGLLENTLIFFLQDNGACAETVGRAAPPHNHTVPEGEEYHVMAGSELQRYYQPWQTRDGLPVRRGYGVLPGAADTYIAYGKGWAHYSNVPFREYKHWVHEGGIATPLIVHWPAVIRTKGAIRQTPGQLPDIMATIIDVAAAEYPESFNGVEITPLAGASLRPTFDADAESARYLFWEHENNKAIRQGKWKLVYKFTQNTPYQDIDSPTPYHLWELYDMTADRTETRNVAALYPQKVKQLADEWERIAWQSNVKPYPQKKYF
ncbi:MAG: arylsulfatase [Bacteroidales bacterium]|jgi:arylsulfatase|nr:arylsulfatase [Bacteroidales bacterium]